jgi:group I intron endonuclease
MTRPPVGIYKITNNKNGKVYIGQSQNMYMRWNQHRTALKSGHHSNREMQADWNKFSRSFRWDVVEYCSLKELNEREKYWIEKYNSIEEGYNQGWVPFKRKKENKNKPRGYGR